MYRVSQVLGSSPSFATIYHITAARAGNRRATNNVTEAGRARDHHQWNTVTGVASATSGIVLNIPNILNGIK